MQYHPSMDASKKGFGWSAISDTIINTSEASFSARELEISLVSKQTCQP